MPLNNLSVAQIKVGVLMRADALIRKWARREHCGRCCILKENRTNRCVCDVWGVVSFFPLVLRKMTGAWVQQWTERNSPNNQTERKKVNLHGDVTVKHTVWGRGGRQILESRLRMHKSCTSANVYLTVKTFYILTDIAPPTPFPINSSSQEKLEWQRMEKGKSFLIPLELHRELHIFLIDDCWLKIHFFFNWNKS